MGLDIHARANATYLPDAKPDYDSSEWWMTHVDDVHRSAFAHAHEGIAATEGQRLVWRAQYDHNNPEGHMGYGGYYEFRRRLIIATQGRTPGGSRSDDIRLEPGEPFFEMVFMSDCEGVFTTPACKRIAADFDRHRDAYLQLPMTWMRDPYDEWAAVFRFAADNDGIVVYA